ncbi:MFS transporter [Clostridium sp. AM33-3]|uniref:MFS transporter n=1 Tax=Clostridium sp. AM33-3 TaxID=2292304 RepID=UPI000E49832B|nr:MFS transporter [Clostridium sp. AM33-3]RHT17332.1 MFS transporter [Clostridium sp. AM33-3]
MKYSYDSTMRACFTGYIVQAIVNNFAPLLFLTFQRTYHIPLQQITLLVTFNFGIQLLTDLLSVAFVDRMGYRASMVLAHILSALGLICLTVLPDRMGHPFAGILISVIVYAVGGGLLEVLVSPVVEACPSTHKEKAMSMLHSFYCWGHVGVVLFSSIFFKLAGIENWKLLAVLWAVIPILNALIFTRVPIAPVLPEGEEGMTIVTLFQNRTFWLLFVMMICAGASEQSVSQWDSLFAEKGLGISKTAGDLAGPMAFAFLMGASRAFYGNYGEKINLDRFMAVSSVLCILSYLCLVFMPVPVLSLAGCALCGLSVGILWPGTFSRASKALPAGGTALFALLALGGDIGCSGGPTLVGMVSGMCKGNLKAGILAALIFPVLLLTGAKFETKKDKISS